MPKNREEKKMLNLWAGQKTIAQVDELQKGLGTYKSEVLRQAIKEMYERYKSGKYDQRPIEERVEEIEKRLAKLEAKQVPIPETHRPSTPSKASTATNQESAKNKQKTPSTVNPNFDQSKIDQLILEKTESGWSADEIATYLNENNLKTQRGRDWTGNTIYKRRYILRGGKKG